MKYPMAGLAMLLAVTSPALAEQAPSAPPAGAPVINADTPIETLLSAPAAKAALEKHFPGLTAHPAFDQFKTMSLRQLAPYSNGAITDEKIEAFENELKAKPH